jgi:hypothetical protein
MPWHCDRVGDDEPAEKTCGDWCVGFFSILLNEAARRRSALTLQLELA